MCVPGKIIHAQKFLHIGYNVDPYGQSFFPNSFSAWNGLAKNIAEANTLDLSLNYKIRFHSQSISKHIRKRILLINDEPEFNSVFLKLQFEAFYTVNLLNAKWKVVPARNSVWKKRKPI